MGLKFSLPFIRVQKSDWMCLCVCARFASLWWFLCIFNDALQLTVHTANFFFKKLDDYASKQTFFKMYLIIDFYSSFLFGVCCQHCVQCTQYRVYTLKLWVKIGTFLNDVQAFACGICKGICNTFLIIDILCQIIFRMSHQWLQSTLTQYLTA